VQGGDQLARAAVRLAVPFALLYCQQPIQRETEIDPSLS